MTNEALPKTTPSAPAAQPIFASTGDKTKTVDRALAQKRTTDGFQNFALKLGVAARGAEGCEDNALSDAQYTFNLVTRNRVLLEAAYRGSWVVGRVVDCKAVDMTKYGAMITTNDEAEKLQELKVLMARLQIWQSLADVIKWGDLYGGSIGVMQIEGQRLDTPLDLETVGKGQFKGIAVYDRWQLNPDLTNTINVGPEIGLPQYYNIVLGLNSTNAGQAPGEDGDKPNPTGQVRVHHSRCVRMIGIKLPFAQAITESMWGESVLERLWDRLIEFDTATAASGSLITRANLRMVGIDGLREILGAGGAAEEALISQFDYIRKFQSSEGLTLLDKEDTYNTSAYSFAGLSDMMIQFCQQLSGAADIPMVRLFGQSPAGFNATGESDMQMYYEGIGAKQESSLRNPFEVVLKVLWRSMTGQAAPTDLSFLFMPLKQLSAKEKSEIAAANVNSIISAHTDGVISTVVAMKELKHQSAETGLFTNITDEEIEEAENEEPPTPEDDPAIEPIEKPTEKPADKIKKAVGDSIWKKISRIVLGANFQPHGLIERPSYKMMTVDQKAIRAFLK